MAFALTIQSHSFHKSKFASSSNFLTGGIYSLSSGISDYFGLETENDKLLKENIRLRQLLEVANTNQITTDTRFRSNQFEYLTAKVINNNYARTKNTITLKKGTRDSVKIDQGVITSNGIVGIVNSVSKNYATVQSILNTNSRINAKLKGTNQFGFLIWDTKTPNVVQLTQIPRLAPVVKGDTIVTGGKSTIFPEEIPIGTINDFSLNDDDSYTINVSLFNDMTNLKNVYIITNKDKKEILLLEETVADDAE